MSDFHFVAVPGVVGTTAGTAIADFAQGGTVSDVVSFKKYQTAYFIVSWGVGTTGQLTLTAIPCDDALKTATTTAIYFKYKRVSSTETNTAWTSSASLLTTAGSDQAYIIKVDANYLPEVSGAIYEYLYLNMAETEDDPLIGGCIIMMADPRYNEATLDAVTA